MKHFLESFRPIIPILIIIIIILFRLTHFVSVNGCAMSLTTTTATNVETYITDLSQRALIFTVSLHRTDCVDARYFKSSHLPP